MLRLAEAAVYATALAGFAYVFVAAARLRHETLILACIPPVFVSIIMGFVMGIYAWDSFGYAPLIVALGPVPVAWRLADRYSAKDLLITIYLAWAVGLVAALIGFGFPDAEG